MIAVAALGLGVFAGAAAGGSFRGLTSVRLRFEAVLLAAFVFQGMARGRLVATSPTRWGMIAWVIASIAMILLLSLNLRRPGIPIAAAGILLNLLVVLANSGMPVSVGHLASASHGISVRSAGFYVVANASTLGAAVSDTIPLTMLGQTYLLSVGDILLAVGVAVTIASSMLVNIASVESEV